MAPASDAVSPKSQTLSPPSQLFAPTAIVTLPATAYDRIELPSGATSAGFTIAPGAATRLAFAVQPTAAVAGTAIAPAVQGAEHDAFGTPDPALAGGATTVGISGPLAISWVGRQPPMGVLSQAS